jgi:hypothetical protein
LYLVGEAWPTELPCRPMVGDIIESLTKRAKGYGLELEVCRVIFRSKEMNYGEEKREVYLDVELHLIPTRWQNVSEFEKWYYEIWLKS